MVSYYYRSLKNDITKGIGVGGLGYFRKRIVMEPEKSSKIFFKSRNSLEGPRKFEINRNLLFLASLLNTSLRLAEN